MLVGDRHAVLEPVDSDVAAGLDQAHDVVAGGDAALVGRDPFGAPAKLAPLENQLAFLGPFGAAAGQLDALGDRRTAVLGGDDLYS